VSQAALEPPAVPPVPDPVRAVVGALARAGHEAVLVGGCLRDLCLGRPVADWDLATAAPPEAVLALFARAVPIGLRHGTVMLPTAAGPIDVTTYRGPQGDLAGDLARRDFTVNAMALALEPPRWIDPAGGLADLRAKRLRAVGDPGARLDEDPLRALRALRLASELGFALDPALADAIRARAPRLRAVAAERVRAELERLLRGPFVAAALGLARALGVEGVLLGPCAPDAPAVAAALPSDLTLRLAAWLRGRDAGAVLARLRFPRARTDAVAQLVRLHPIDARSEPGDLGRLLVRIERSGVEALLALRSAELDAGTLRPADAAPVRARLAALRDALERLERTGVLPGGRPRLAATGRDIMAWLDTGPGPHVGRALRHLTEQVLEDPSRNEPATLRRIALAWAETAPQADDPASSRPRPSTRS